MSTDWKFRSVYKLAKTQPACVSPSTHVSQRKNKGRVGGELLCSLVCKVYSSGFTVICFDVMNALWVRSYFPAFESYSTSSLSDLLESHISVWKSNLEKSLAFEGP